jgi:serine/threonine protein kinase/tetratricopeptide (TPR) repeat protein
MNDEEIFHQALARADPAERAAYLGRACAGEPALRASVEALLRASEGASGFLAGPAPGLGPPVEAPGREGPGAVIGPYKLLEVIGEGGMGIVYMAEQVRPVRRKVALKVVKPGMDTRQVVARFEAERQALALMDHPDIAKVLDAGATESGRPYFVMELVRGIPITDYSDRERLPIPERLGLFVLVCQAVQHAHQKGIIHRDLKPSNILVTMIDGAAVPKVIDFGVAKAMGQSLTERTLFTAFAQLVGTPLYMSPEQAALSGVDVDTRSDIYSLGVLLYELLTGTTPFDRAAMGQAGWDEVRRLIREIEPPKPSTRLSGLGDTLTEVAANRQTDARRLDRALRGELDWVVLKALEKDRRLRYETAAALAADVTRHLEDRPVEAGPPSAWYRFAKFARRNRAALLTAAAAGVMLTATAAGLAAGMVVVARERDAARQAAAGERRMAEAADLQRRAADRERRRAEANFRQARAAVDRVFTRAAEEMAGQPHMDRIRRALLVDALEFYRGFLEQKGDDPSVRREATQTYLRVGRIEVLLGRYAEALGPLGRARALLEDLARREPDVPAHREDLAELHQLASYVGVNKPDHQLTMEHRERWLALREQLRREAPGEPEPLRREAYARIAYGEALRDNGRPREALEHYRRALALYERSRADFPGAADDLALPAHANHWLGAALHDLGRGEEAEQALRWSYELRKRQLAGQPRDPTARHKLAHVGAYLAYVLTRSGRSGEAEDLFREAVRIGEDLLDDYPDNADYLRRAAIDYYQLGVLLSGMGRTEEAEAAFRRALAICTSEAASNARAIARFVSAWCYYELGVLREATGKPDDAAAAFRQAIGILEELTSQIPEEARYRGRLGWVLATCPAVQFRDPARAVRLARQALQREPGAAWYWGLLGIAQYRAGDSSGAIESLNKAMGLLNGGDACQWTFLAMAHERLGHREQARNWYEKAVAWAEKNRTSLSEYRRFLAEAAALLGRNDPNPGPIEAPATRQPPSPP